MRTRPSPTSPTARPTTRVAAAAAGLLLLAGLSACGGGDDGSTPGVQPDETSSSTLNSIESQRPRPGDCHAMTLDEVTATSAGDTARDCSHVPTAITVFVGDLEVKGRKVEADSPAAQRLMERTCKPKAAAWLGTDLAGLRLSRLQAFWFEPTPEQLDAGATWFRCDVVGFDRGNHLQLLPPPHELKGALKGDRAERYALCGTAKPGSGQFQRVTCSMKHSWKAIATVDLEGGKAYPGDKAVRDGGDQTCSDKARERAGDATRYDYGWEWPSRGQWAAGQHFGYCWAPA